LNRKLTDEPTVSFFVYLVGRRPFAWHYKQSEYGKVILPFTVLRRFGLRVGTDEGGRARRTGCEKETKKQRNKETRIELGAIPAPQGETEFLQHVARLGTPAIVMTPFACGKVA
jgi:hypothetical protein